jgi:hypothetical protein
MQPCCTMAHTTPASLPNLMSLNFPTLQSVLPSFRAPVESVFEHFYMIESSLLGSNPSVSIHNGPFRIRGQRLHRRGPSRDSTITIPFTGNMDFFSFRARLSIS